MKIMVIASGIGGVAAFILLWALFSATLGRNGPDHGIVTVFSVMGAIPGAAIGALFAAVSVIRMELREIRRELKHWQSLQTLDMDVDLPSTQFKSAPQTGRR